MPHTISGINTVKETLRQGKKIAELFVARGKRVGRLREILDMATQKGIPIKLKDRLTLDKLSPHLPHQGVIAIVSEYTYFTVEDLISLSLANKRRGLLIAADHITDAGNLGSLIRTGEFFGAHGLIVPKDRSASVTETVHKRSAGGSAYLPIAKVVNLARTLKQLADNDFWIVGTAGKSETSIFEFDWNRDIVLVVGSEGKGLSVIVRNQCHHLVSIPQLGHLDSLNVSVAAGVILSEIIRQRGDASFKGSIS